MAIDFPKFPTSGQTYSAYSITWEYDGYGWKKLGGGGTTGAIVNNFTESGTAPASPTAGDRWFNTTDGKLYTAITDDSGIIWVELLLAVPLVFGQIPTQGLLMELHQALHLRWGLVQFRFWNS